MDNNWKIIGVFLLVTAVVISAGCLGGDDDGGGGGDGFDKNGNIVVVGRDSASGTRASFEELAMDEETPVATMMEMNSNNMVYETVKGNEQAIGYVGLGYVDSGVTGVKVDGVSPSEATVQDGTYPIARQLNFVTNGEATGLARDFIDFVLSPDGQDIVSDEGFVKLGTRGTRADELSLAGSTTVLPVAQAAADAYMDDHGDANIVVSGGGSSVGVQAAVEGTADIGMASRSLKDSEKADHPELVVIPIANDGIAVIVHKDNPITDLTKEQIKDIYTGKITKWSEI